MPLSKDELAQFHEKGFIVRRHLFDPGLIADLAGQIDGLHEQMARHAPPEVHVAWEDAQAPGRPRRIRQLMHSDQASPLIDQITRSDEVLSVMEQVIGPDVYLFHSKLLMKAARDGTFTPWHQDWGYWRHGFREPSQVNCMLAIDPATEQNGAIRFVPGSHKQGPIDHRKIQSSSFSTALEGDLDAFESELIEMDPGDAVFFGPLVIHGSGPNQSDRDRRANTMAFDRPQNHLDPEKEFRLQQHRRGRVVSQAGR